MATQQTTPVGTIASGGTLAHEVYESLRQDILLGRLRPNEHLVEAELANRLQVSRTPVRESLQRLASDGLIVSRRRRWVVYEPTLEEIREIYEVRLCQEGYAARLACERASDEQLADIARVIDAPARGDDGRGGEPMVERNERFHRLIVLGSGNRRLTELIEKNRQYYFNIRVALLYEPGDVATSQRQHRELVEALLARDGARAEAVTREHVNHALRMILEKLR